jgi:hypothetical protein
MRRFTGLTNALSKRFENHVHMATLHAAWYHWERTHETMPATPAMEAVRLIG